MKTQAGTPDRFEIDFAKILSREADAARWAAEVHASAGIEQTRRVFRGVHRLAVSDAAVVDSRVRRLRHGELDDFGLAALASCLAERCRAASSPACDLSLLGCVGELRRRGREDVIGQLGLGDVEREVTIRTIVEQPRGGFDFVVPIHVAL